jgi:hypothetical protein
MQNQKPTNLITETINPEKCVGKHGSCEHLATVSVTHPTQGEIRLCDECKAEYDKTK